MAPLSNIVASSSLVLLSAVGFYFTWTLLMNNGTAEQMKRIREVGPQLLPGTPEPIKTSYTGIEGIDYQLGVLTLFFWEMIDGSRPNASLFSFYFGGQLAAGWCLFLMEGLRNGNRWRIISFMTIWGIAMQRVSFAVAMPIYMAIHLSTSPTVLSDDMSDLYFDVSKLASIPLSMLIGFIVPAIMLALPSPSVLGFDLKQTFMAVWQVFPIWVGLLQQILPSIMSICGVTCEHPGDQDYVSDLWIGTARLVYIILLYFAAAIHISTMTLVAASKFLPELYKLEHPFKLSMVFIPASLSASTKMSSIGSGALQLLQYDFLVGSAAIAIWASTLVMMPKRRVHTIWTWLRQALEFILLTALVGPFGYAISCIWARDEFDFERVSERVLYNASIADAKM